MASTCDAVAATETAPGAVALAGRWTYNVPAPSSERAARHESGRSAASAADGEVRRCTVPAATVKERIRRHVDESPYYARLLGEPWLDELLADDRMRRLFGRSKSRKEITEAYAAAEQVRRMLRALGGDSERGRGAVVFDVCSGRGVGALLLSFLLPESRVVMVDVDGAMDLSHVQARPNLAFCELDLFSEGAPAVLRAAAAGASVRVATAMHLCGALSPRLITLACRLDLLDAFVCCPCCLKGSLGTEVKAASRRQSRDPHAVLLDTLLALCQREATDGDDVGLFIDAHMCSPKNGFVGVVKRRGAAPPAESCEPCEDEPGGGAA